MKHVYFANEYFANVYFAFSYGTRKGHESQTIKKTFGIWDKVFRQGSNLSDKAHKSSGIVKMEVR